MCIVLVQYQVRMVKLHMHELMRYSLLIMRLIITIFYSILMVKKLFLNKTEINGTN